VEGAAAAEVALDIHEHGPVGVAAPIAQAIVFNAAYGMSGDAYLSSSC
jgi:hypothetical protein